MPAPSQPNWRRTLSRLGLLLLLVGGGADALAFKALRAVNREQANIDARQQAAIHHSQHSLNSLGTLQRSSDGVHRLRPSDPEELTRSDLATIGAEVNALHAKQVGHEAERGQLETRRIILSRLALALVLPPAVGLALVLYCLAPTKSPAAAND